MMHAYMLLIARCFSCRNIKRFSYNYMDYSGYIALENQIIGFDVMKQPFDNVENVGFV